jgi:hypothetical protein
MTGIISYGAYVPLHRLGPETKGWGFPFEKAVGYYDEDSLTMAVAAALDCLGRSDRNAVDGVYFASTTAPYREKQTATTAAIACDLRSDILTVDFANSLRAGTAALKTALDTVKAGSAKNLLVTASDCGRLGQPRTASTKITATVQHPFSSATATSLPQLRPAIPFPTRCWMCGATIPANTSAHGKTVLSWTRGISGCFPPRSPHS